ncbi:hypothetical protein BH23BAC1_BH23BAC1_32560 [soil metagenome]
MAAINDLNILLAMDNLLIVWKKLSLTLIFISFTFLHSFATWSIIILDPETKEIGIAGASCSYNCYGIGEILPGKGAIIVQAMSNNKARSKGLQMLASDASPEEIIKVLCDPKFDPENQQYAVLSFMHLDQPKSYTGKSAADHKGSMASWGISVQGNILTNENEIKIIYEAALKAKEKKLSVEEILITALKAGSKAGGDQRCGAQKATSAFITVAKPGDKPKHFYLDLVVSGQRKGGDNAVELLRAKYDLWKSGSSVNRN